VYKHRLLELNKIIEQRIGLLIEEIEIANSARLSLTDLKDEMISKGSCSFQEFVVLVESALSLCTEKSQL